MTGHPQSTQFVDSHRGTGWRSQRDVPVWASRAGVIGGVILFVASVAVMVGWLTGKISMTRAPPYSVPMHFNTALCFGLLGVSIAMDFLGYGKRRLPIGLLAVLIAAITLWQYASGMALGIDDLFLQSAITEGASTSARMAPNTAICFVFLGLSFSGLWRFFDHTVRRSLNVFCALTVLIISAVAISGYVIGAESSYAWRGAAPMALLTACAFFALSFGSLVFTTAEVRIHPNRYVNWSPVAIFLVALALAIALTTRSAEADSANRESAQRGAAARLADRVEQEANAHRLAVLRFAKEYARRPEPQFFALRAENLLDDFTGLVFLATLDSGQPSPVAVGNINAAKRTYDSLPAGDILDSFSRTGEYIAPHKDTRIDDLLLLAIPLAVAEASGQSAESATVRYLLAGIDISQLGAVSTGRSGVGFGRIHLDALRKEGFAHDGFVTKDHLRFSNTAIPISIFQDATSDTQGHIYLLIFLGGLLFAVLVSVLLAFLLNTLSAARQQKQAIAQAEANQATNQALSNRLQLALGLAEVGSWHWSAGNPMQLDTGARTILGITSESLAPEAFMQCIHPEDEPDVRRKLQAGLKNTTLFAGEFRCVLDSGQVVHLEAAARTKIGKTGRAESLVGVLRDITSQVEAKKALSDAARTDSLTGLWNRKAFDEHLTRECASARRHKRPLSLMMLDMDFFKLLNDALGHVAGDNALVEMANIMLITVRRTTDFASRYGGEEFCVVLPDTDAEGAVVVGNMMQAKLQKRAMPNPTSPAPHLVTVSIGIAEFDPAKHRDNSDLIKAADAALYFAKSSGRNQIQTTPAPACLDQPTADMEPTDQPAANDS